jgi:hypothetical protein
MATMPITIMIMPNTMFVMRSGEGDMIARVMKELLQLSILTDVQI